jgi:hypothetical protein
VTCEGGAAAPVNAGKAETDERGAGLLDKDAEVPNRLGEASFCAVASLVVSLEDVDFGVCEGKMKAGFGAVTSFVASVGVIDDGVCEGKVKAGLVDGELDCGFDDSEF